MRYREIAPSGAAREFVECYWELEDAGDGGAQRVVPDGRAELILNFGRPFEALRDGVWEAQPRAFLVGQITGPLMLRTAGPAHIVGIRLRPSGANRLLGIPAEELTGRSIALDELGLKGIGDRCDVGGIEEALLACTRGETDALVDEAIRLFDGTDDVARVAERLGVSSRQLERRFKLKVGLSPKFFARIRRFQRVFPELESEGWVGAAAACGYYDQAHLIRDFRAFAGEPPAALVSGNELARHFLSHFSKTAKSGLR
ncbi:MAG: transcriptional regulator, Fis family [Candidatus Solibacter sp.]|jgi:AraC-like DNA-binding protein|nr:transcriptional regulator, Fis family [Candidatus Solibacter sp.]